VLVAQDQASLVAISVAGAAVAVAGYASSWRLPETEAENASFLSALFMAGASGLLLALFALGLSVLHIFLVLSPMNAAAAVHVHRLLPEWFHYGHTRKRAVRRRLAKLLIYKRARGDSNTRPTGSKPAALVQLSYGRIDLREKVKAERGKRCKRADTLV
jgi:hypothetical protein